MHFSTFVALALAVAAADARPARRFGRRASFDLSNGQAAIALNDQFKTLTADSACTAGQDACVNQQFAQCVGGKFVLQPCAPGTICAALPLVNSAGTSITCTTQSDLDARIAATGATSAAAPPAAAASSTDAAAAASTDAAPPAASSAAAAPPDTAAPPAAADSGDPQSSLTISQSVIQTTDDGQNPAVKGQTAAATSPNNFANLCATTLDTIPLTNGLQITTGSCNPIPIGYIPSVDNMVASKFQNPPNFATIPAQQTFNVVLKTVGMQIGSFSNAQKTYFGNPQTLNAQGQIIGHTHVVIESIPSVTSTDITNPQNFIFFKGVDDPNDGNNEVTVPVTGGLKAGAYRMCTITSSLTHQPVIMPVAQHGSCDDCVYFTAADGGAAAGNATAAAGAAAAPAAAAAGGAAAAAPAAAVAKAQVPAKSGKSSKKSRTA